jgi:SAM-dependent MidA family methyltransferase
VAGVLVANEWLDNVPFDVAELTADGVRLVEVDDGGATRLGPAAGAEDLAWLDAWWALAEAGAQADVGRFRDAAWAGAVGRLAAGVAVAIDYAHVKGARPAYSTLTGYAEGRQVAPVPDGSCDLTAHVALDACAAAARVDATLFTTQREALRQLGLTGARPPRELASDDPVEYLRRLTAASEDGELLDPGGLGGFTWLVQAKGVPLPLN